MCSANDHPPYDPPTPTRPRKYELSGDGPRSVALAVLGTMLMEAEAAGHSMTGVRVLTLREARRRVGEAEAAL